MDNQNLKVNTPLGPIEAKIMPDDEYVGISLLFTEPGTGEPGAIMEYDPHKRKIQLRVYSADDPDADPSEVYIMGTQKQVEELRLDQAVQAVCKNCLTGSCETCPVRSVHVNNEEADSAGLTSFDKASEERIADALADILRKKPKRTAPTTTGSKIRFLRELKGWTQTELGRKAGMPDSQVGTYERDETKPRAGSLERIAAALGVEVSYFEQTAACS